jgi:cyclopropane fatty-acyl-phospholipid synthase-like methyltransferase
MHVEEVCVSKTFIGSAQYWENRYKSGNNSGKGSYGELAEFKAEVLNAFVLEKGIRSVIEFGCGDGNQLSLAVYPQYVGYDVSAVAVEMCQKAFADDRTKVFALVDEYQGERADLAISLDVLFHLVEDEVFETYMRRLFGGSDRFVVIYCSDIDRPVQPSSPHVRHRNFSAWVTRHIPSFQLIRKVGNRYRDGRKTRQGHSSPSDFFIYERCARPS